MDEPKYDNFFSEYDLPIDYFKKFLKDEMISVITESTNNYSLDEQSGRPICVTTEEMEQYIGILIHMGVIDMPDYCMFWQKDTLYPTISNTMAKKRSFILNIISIFR